MEGIIVCSFQPVEQSGHSEWSQGLGVQPRHDANEGIWWCHRTTHHSLARFLYALFISAWLAERRTPRIVYGSFSAVASANCKLRANRKTASVTRDILGLTLLLLSITASCYSRPNTDHTFRYRLSAEFELRSWPETDVCMKRNVLLCRYMVWIFWRTPRQCEKATKTVLANANGTASLCSLMEKVELPVVDFIISRVAPCWATRCWSSERNRCKHAFILKVGFAVALPNVLNNKHFDWFPANSEKNNLFHFIKHVPKSKSRICVFYSFSVCRWEG